MQSTILSVLTVVSVWSGTMVDAVPQATIPQQVRQHGDVNVSSLSTAPLMSLDDVIASSDLILRAKAVSKAARLSSDERYVTTDCGLEPVTVFLQKRNSRSTPGPLARLVVSVLGGDMVLEGHKVSWTDSSLRALDLGREYILFLQESPELGTYILTGSANGVFEVDNGTVTPRRKAHDRANEPVGSFIQRLQEIIGRTK